MYIKVKEGENDDGLDLAAYENNKVPNLATHTAQLSEDQYE
jgi:hypothetical protein